MNVKNLCLALFGIAGAILISSNPVLASYFLRIQRVDPAPYDKSGNIASYTNISSSSCQLRCQNNGACQAYYWVNGNCWLKRRVNSPLRKDFEEGIGGIKIDEN